MEMRGVFSLLIASSAVWLTSNYCRPDPPVPTNNKLILSWAPRFGDYSFSFGHGTPEDFKKAGCKYTNCEIIKRRWLYPLQRIDAFLFHGFEDYEILFGTPRVRFDHQIYIFYCVESVRRSYIAERRRNFFNMTFTYRLDSDIAWPYFGVYDAETEELVAPSFNPQWISTMVLKGSKVQQDIDALIASKTHTAAWLVSNCHSVSGREEYVKKLQELGIDVHIYGACGTYKCPFSENCKKIISKYYFYIAFENSLCEDYVTEKTITAFESGSVPAVLSGANLTRFLPPNSYLDAQELGPVELAKEMKRLMADKKSYAEKLYWRQRYKVAKYTYLTEKTGHHPFCSVCEAVNTGKVITKRNKEVLDWWHSSQTGDGGSCLM